MKYQHEHTDRDNTPYASGVVFHSLGGHPPLPVRLSSEMFLRAYQLWSPKSDKACTLYDPLCGSGATLTALKFLHWPLIGKLIGSDISSRAVEVASLNFRLLTPQGMQQRIDKLKSDSAAYGKASHQEALAAALHLSQRIGDSAQTHLFLADATAQDQLQAGLNNDLVDIAFLDIPYGSAATWSGEASTLHSEIAIQHVLKALRPVISPSGVAVVFMPKKHKIDLGNFSRLQHIKVGKREIWLLRPV